MRVLQLFEEAARNSRESTRTERKKPACTAPPLGIGREAAAGHDAMHVWMVSQGRAPRVQHRVVPIRAPSASDRRRSCAASRQRCRTTVHRVSPCGVGDGADRRWQGEHDVVIRNRQEVGLRASSQRCAALLWHFGQCRCGTSYRRSAVRRTPNSAARGRRARGCGTARWPTSPSTGRG